MQGRLMAARWLARWRRRFLGIRPAEVDFDRLGFRWGVSGVRGKLERICAAFVDGYHAALETSSVAELDPALERTPLEWRGFSFEGAAMALALLDWLTPWRRDRVARLLAGAGDAHAYLVHVGVGWALARLPANLERTMSRFDPLLRWLIPDGYGFHDGFFHAHECVSGRPAPSRLKGYQRRAYDQGLGRCLWFIEGGDIEAIPRTIARFVPERHADLWSGVGLAGAYAGVVEEVAALRSLVRTAGTCQPHLAQGAAFAAKARWRASNATAATEMACEVFCGMSADAASAVTDEALARLSLEGEEPAYELWCRAVQGRFGHRAPNAHA